MFLGKIDEVGDDDYDERCIDRVYARVTHYMGCGDSEDD